MGSTRTKRLEELLKTELDRLKVATAFEQRKQIVFPETTQIVRDILKIEEMIEKKTLATKINQAKGKKKTKLSIDLTKGM